MYVHVSLQKLCVKCDVTFIVDVAFVGGVGNLQHLLDLLLSHLVTQVGHDVSQFRCKTPSRHNKNINNSNMHACIACLPTLMKPLASLSNARNALLISSSISSEYIFFDINARNSMKSMVPFPAESRRHER